MANRIAVSGENAEYQIIESLKLNRAKRAKSGEVFIEGIESIKQAFKAGAEITRIIFAGKVSPWALGTIKRSEGPGGPKIVEMAEGLYRKLCDRAEPSELLATARPVKKTPGEIALPENPFVLVLDRPSDTGNLGSIIRSADAFGVDALFLVGHSADPWDPKAIRASLGSVFFSPLAQIESLEELEGIIRGLKARPGFRVWGTDSAGSVSLAPCAAQGAGGAGTLKRPAMLVMGNEARGMSQALKGLCDGIVRIPIAGNVNSLNLASAASVFMWEVCRNSANEPRA